MAREGSRFPAPSKLTAVLLTPALLVNGCGSPHEELQWTLGSTIFFVYVVVLLVVMVLPALHRWPTFLRLAENARQPAAILGAAVVLAGIAVMAVGLPRFVTEDFGPRKLVMFLGCIVFVGGRNLWLWALASTPMKKAAHAKVFMLSISFGVGLTYVIVGSGAVFD